MLGMPPWCPARSCPALAPDPRREDSMEDTGRRFEPSVLTAFCVAVLEKAGVAKENAETVAHSLLSANLRGVDTHGITRLPIYVERLQAGLTDGHTRGVVVEEG